jgi:hypothetical protein
VRRLSASLRSGRWRWFGLLAAAALLAGLFGGRRAPPLTAASESRGSNPVASASLQGRPNYPALAPDSAPPFLPPVPAAFRFEESPDAAALTAALPAPARAVRYARVDTAWLGGKQSPFWRSPAPGRLRFPLPSGGELEVVLTGTELLGPDRWIGTGELAGRVGGRARGLRSQMVY